MLLELRILNFQAHAKRRIKFSPGVTAIVGSSDVGKSAIIRALRWVACNTPPGLAHRRHGADFVSAELLADDHRVKRFRSNSENRYWLDEQEFASFGNEVPDPIKEFLAIGNHNFQEQHDSPYWLSIPGSQVSRELNAIIDLEIVDDVAAHLTAKTRTAIATLDVVESRLAVATSESNKLATVPAALEAFERVGAIKQLAESRRERADDIRKIYDSAFIAELKITQITESLQTLRPVYELGKIAVAKREKADEFSKLIDELKIAYKASKAVVPELFGLEQLKCMAENARNSANGLRKLVDQIKPNYLASRVKLPSSEVLQELQQKSEAANIARLKRQKLSALIVDIKSAKGLVDDISARLVEAEKELAATPGVCPTCQRPLQS